MIKYPQSFWSETNREIFVYVISSYIFSAWNFKIICVNALYQKYYNEKCQK